MIAFYINEVCIFTVRAKYLFFLLCFFAFFYEGRYFMVKFALPCIAFSGAKIPKCYVSIIQALKSSQLNKKPCEVGYLALLNKGV